MLSDLFLMQSTVLTVGQSDCLIICLFLGRPDLLVAAAVTSREVGFHNLFYSLPLFCEPVLATQATKKEYSSELGPKNYSKMDPKMVPKRQRPTFTKHARALSECMSTPPHTTGELHFHRAVKVR